MKNLPIKQILKAAPHLWRAVDGGDGCFLYTQSFKGESPEARIEVFFAWGKKSDHFSIRVREVIDNTYTHTYRDCEIPKNTALYRTVARVYGGEVL